MSKIIWLNDTFINNEESCIAPDDGGFMLGLGVFDTMLGMDGKPVRAESHYERLINDCHLCLQYKPNLTLTWFIDTCEKLLAENGLSKGAARIRAQITVGQTKEILGKPENPSVIITANPVAKPSVPIDIHAQIIEEFPRITNCRFENCKRLDYTRSYYAKHEAKARGGNEAVITNTDGRIACATTSNLFITEGGKMITPPLEEGVMAGITRRALIEHHDVNEEPISKERLINADTVFLTNSILGVRPVKTVNGQAYETTIPDLAIAA